MTSQSPFPHAQSPAVPPRRPQGSPGAFALQVAPLLDRGMRIYRQHFLSFLASALLWALPFAGLYGLRVLTWGQALAAMPDALAGVLVLLTVGLLLLGLVDALSRLAAEADRGGRPSWRQAWQVRPLRLLSMLMLSTVYIMGALLLTLLLMIIVALLVASLDGLMNALFRGSQATQMLISVLGYLGLMLLGIAFGLTLLSGLCYALQPLIQADGSLWRAFRQGLGGVVRPLRANLRLFLGTGLTASGFALSVLIGVLGLASVPSLIFEPNLDRQPWSSVLLALLLLSIVIPLLPLPIWTAIAYRQRHGLAQLEQRINQLLAAHASLPAPAASADGDGPAPEAPPA